MSSEAHGTRSLSNRPVREVLDLFATRQLLPGGGAAAALAAAIGASLLMRPASLRGTHTNALACGTRPGAADPGTTEGLRMVRDRLVELAALDVTAYRRLMVARRQGRSGAAEPSSVESALRAATGVPLEMMQACRAALELGAAIAGEVPPAATSDLATGVDLLLVGLHGAAECVDANLRGTAATDHLAAMAARRRQLEGEAAQLAGTIRAALVLE